MPNALQITDPDSDNPLAQAPSWADAAQSVAGTVSSGVDLLTQWLAKQRAKNAADGGYAIPLPGITSGAPPKPWGLDRTQLPQQAPAYGSGQSGFIANVLNRLRPMDQAIDPSMAIWPQQVVRTFKVPRGGIGYIPSTPSEPEQQQMPMPWRNPYGDQQT